MSETEETPITPEERARYEGLARNLAAAFLANRLHVKGIDRLRAQYATRPIGDLWIAIARDVDAVLAASVADAIRPLLTSEARRLGLDD